jgi:hypothetical protein
MHLKDLLAKSTKAQLQASYLYWFPGEELYRAKDRLLESLLEAMTDYRRARDRFDALSKSQRSFLMGLLLCRDHCGSVDEARSRTPAKQIEDYEVESILKSLEEWGYIAQRRVLRDGNSETFFIPLELAVALKRTLPLESRAPLEMLSIERSRGENGKNGGAGVAPALQAKPGEVEARLAAIEDAELRAKAWEALLEHGGILTLSNGHAADGAPTPRYDRREWRRELETKGIGTTGILRLKDYGIELEEETLLVFQEIVRGRGLVAAQSLTAENDRELSLGADLLIDLDRVLELLRKEAFEVTRQGSLYRKMEERIAGELVCSRHPELFDGSPVAQILEFCRRLRFFEREGQRLVPDPLRRRVWRKRALLENLKEVFELVRGERFGPRWSFHQGAIRGILLEHLIDSPRDSWLEARPFLDAVVACYLLGLDERGVDKEYQEHLTVDFSNETLMVPLSKLHHDLSYWILHRLALLGVVDVGYHQGAFHSFRLSTLGRRLFGGEAPSSAASRSILINPDFEVLVFPEAPEELNWKLGLFADRVSSERVKRYRLTRDSVKRGLVAGLSREELLGFLEHATDGVPPNVRYSVGEWTEGVELVRRVKALLLRAQSKEGADRLAASLERRGVPHERLNETMVMVRGARNEQLVKELKDQLLAEGLFLE